MKPEYFAGTADDLHPDLLRIWRQLLASEDLSIDDDFFDRGGDSLLATELMLELRQLTGKTIPETLLFEASTVRTLAERLTQEEPPLLKLAVRIGAPAGDETPLIFFHGDWDTGGFYVEHLARKLGPEVPLIAVAPHGMGEEPIPLSIQAMAADRLAAVLESQPQGPYRLGGHCVGAIVALETARLLLARGHRIEIVVMIDPPLVVDGEFARMRQQSASESGSPDRSEMEAVSDDAPSIPDIVASPYSTPGVSERYGNCLSIYRPAPLPVPLALFMSVFDGTPWRGLSDQSELFEVSGDHFDWVTKRADALADRLRSSLHRNRRDAAPGGWPRLVLRFAITTTHVMNWFRPHGAIRND
jgi:oxalate---CoA ligase